VFAGNDSERLRYGTIGTPEKYFLKRTLLCFLVHKFGRKDVNYFEAFIKGFEPQPRPTVGEVFVFVDECHRTQSEKLHRVMKAMMLNAVFIGFTGTPTSEEGSTD
jgi:type I restriction enzyme, R subunit